MKKKLKPKKKQDKKSWQKRNEARQPRQEAYQVHAALLREEIRDTMAEDGLEFAADYSSAGCEMGCE